MLGWLKRKIEAVEFERKTKTLRQAFGISQDLREEKDCGNFQSFLVETEMPDLNGAEEKVNIVRTEKGIVFLKQSNQEPIPDIFSLSPENLQKIPSDVDEGVFVHLILKSKYKGIEDTICPCFIELNGNFYGDARAFWWSLARGNVQGMFVKINNTRMTAKAYAQVRAAAYGMWQSAIEHDGSIDRMRDTLVIARNVHLDVFGKMKSKYESHASTIFGIDIVSAMVLATQSGDLKLEATAFENLKQFIWEPEQEPEEFLVSAN